MAKNKQSGCSPQPSGCTGAAGSHAKHLCHSFMQGTQKWAPSSQRYSLQLTEIPSVGR